ncbi:DoxX domain protein [Natrialba magadii ATCC 43099]|uniref:DoxX domain protein n=1 Tax=Natrialba magadii (strain ATCC 43099 / DSM 3394 / CCM 3739 / CIP 104546 / IAM 13178 / JCM 8861 / NBRC 102185 / NCIMB 2190 / MS3) TaxID=547559 RepID=D3SXW1_NATMM|nr:DoxX family protein [Natrialba magadii]ADD04001.1 DoxX domain protein [Natrialba magadii ATCC 43099]ELY33158.1 DoxX family protein [Natrialba magadii ATCC 43099]
MGHRHCHRHRHRRRRRRRRRRIRLASVFVLSLLILAPSRVSAHEEYVVDDEEDVALGEFFSEALSDPHVIGPLVAGALAVALLVGGYLLVRPFQRDLAAFRFAMREYIEYVPWLLRISLGIPLIGAGFSGYFISPALEFDLRLLQIALGFLLLFGLATRVVALVGLATRVVGVVIWPTLLLQLEFVGGLAAIALLGSGQPSADHVLQRVAGSPGTVYRRLDPVHERARGFQARIDPYERYLPAVVRVGLGATFIYLGVTQKLLQPGLALAVVDRYDLTAVIPASPELWVMGAGLAEAGLGIAIILGFFTRASAAAALAMFSLTLFALPDDPVLAHVALFGMASVLLITGGGPYALDSRLERLEADTDAETADATPTEATQARG